MRYEVKAFFDLAEITYFLNEKKVNGTNIEREYVDLKVVQSEDKYILFYKTNEEYGNELTMEDVPF